VSRCLRADGYASGGLTVTVPDYEYLHTVQIFDENHVTLSVVYQGQTVHVSPSDGMAVMRARQDAVVVEAGSANPCVPDVEYDLDSFNRLRVEFALGESGEDGMESLENVEVRPIEGKDLQTAALVAARGMRDNPLHVAAIGDDPERRVRVLQRVFSWLLALSGRPTLGAWDGDRLVGVAGSAEPGRCQPSLREGVRLAPAMVMAGGAAPRIARWFSAWGKYDPDRAHSHLGPVAVDLDLQGRGIGSLLLTAYCRRLDEAGVLSYLETDKTENVRLYERFGFVVTAEADVIGVKNWFMTRQASSPGAD